MSTGRDGIREEEEEEKEEEVEEEEGRRSSMHVATTKCVPYLEDGKVNSQSEPVSPSLREAETHHRRQKRHPLPDPRPPAPGAVSLLFLPP